MAIRIRLYADYVDWPLWGPRGGPLAEEELTDGRAIQVELQAQLGPEFDVVFVT